MPYERIRKSWHGIVRSANATILKSWHMAASAFNEMRYWRMPILKSCNDATIAANENEHAAHIVTHAAMEHQNQTHGQLEMQWIGYANIDLACRHCYTQRLPGNAPIAAIPAMILFSKPDKHR